MFKSIHFTKFGISKSVIALAAAATIAVGSFGSGGGHAEARINGAPQTSFATACKAMQDGYDEAVKLFYAAETPDELLEARYFANYFMNAWKNAGCDQYYGDIRFIVAGGLGTVTSTGLTTTSAGTSGGVSVTPAGTATRR